MIQVKYENQLLINKKVKYSYSPKELNTIQGSSLFFFFFFEMLRDPQAITCLISANQQYVYLTFVVALTVKYPN